MVTARRGRTRLGCLFTLLILAAVGYFAFQVGEVYYRFYRFQDAMAQEARFAARRDDGEIVARLRATADSLDLPETAARIRVRRTADRISIFSEYYDRLPLPFVTREVYFTPHAEWIF